MARTTGRAAVQKNLSNVPAALLVASMTERLNFRFSQSRVGLSPAAAVLVGLLISFAYPLGIAASVAVPALAMRQHTRRRSYTIAATYYAAALWPLVPGAHNFFTAHTSLELAVLLWLTAAILLAAPWAIFWSGDRRSVPWRAALALLASVVPPLGIIGWASPLTAAPPHQMVSNPLPGMVMI
jgi:hypothetical protein